MSEFNFIEEGGNVKAPRTKSYIPWRTRLYNKKVVVVDYMGLFNFDIELSYAYDISKGKLESALWLNHSNDHHRAYERFVADGS